MTLEQWNNLKEGDVIHNPVDGNMVVHYYDYFGEGKEICLCSDGWIWPASEFDHDDWELIKEGK